MKFKNYIETESGIKDTSTSPGTAGQLLSSTVAGTSWIDQAEIVAAGATRVLIACKNTSGGTITKGTPVYQTGNVGATDVIEIAEADALISTGYLPAIGLLETDLINNAFGNVVITGELLNITTDPIDGLTPTTGDTIYLKSGGGLTLTKPTGEGNAIQNLGLVGKVSGGNAGSLTVASIMRQNDVPNLPTGKIWVGDGNTIVSDVVYLDETNERMGIGTTSPQEKLHIYSTGAGPVRVEIESTQAADSVVKYTNSVRSYGTFLTQSGQFTIYDYNAASHRFYMLTNGNIGIGTTTPSTNLEVSSTGVNGVDISQSASNASQSGRLFFTTNTASEGFALFNSNGTFQVNSGGIPNNTSGTNRISIIGSSGNVGIGTTSPDYKLEVDGTLGVSRTDGIIFAGSGGSGQGNKITSDTSNNLIFSTSLTGAPYTTTEKVRILNNGNVGIGTTSPTALLTLESSSTSPYPSIDIKSTSYYPGSKIRFLDSSESEVSTIESWSNPSISYLKLHYGTTTAFSSTLTLDDGFLYLSTAGSEKMRIKSNGDVGIGTTNPNSKLQVEGEIDANGGDGYRINGKPWAVENSNILRLGDWDGEGFSTSIFDENSIETFKVKDQGVIINCDRTSSTVFGVDAGLVVGGSKFSSWGPGVITLLNNDPSSLTNDSTGLIQFAIKDDATSEAGYTSASIKGSIGAAAGSGSSGGGILDFLTSSGTTGSSPTIRMRINQSGSVGIGVSSVRAKLHVNGGIKLGNDTDSPSASKAGTFRYYTSGNNSYVDMCMQTGASTYAWVNIVTNSW